MLRSICFLRYSYLIPYLFIILKELLFMYGKVTKLIKWKRLYKWLLQTIYSLNLFNQLL